MANNKIPRKFKEIWAKQKTPTNGGQVGDLWKMTRADGVITGQNMRTGKRFIVFAAHLRNPELWQFEIVAI